MRNLIYTLFIGSSLFLVSCNKPEPIEPVAVDYNYLLDGTWYEVNRIYTVKSDTAYRQADTIATTKGQKYVNFYRGVVAYYESGKPSESKIYEFTNGINLKIITPEQTGNEELYTLSFSNNQMTAYMKRTTTNGLQEFQEETTIQYVR